MKILFCQNQNNQYDCLKRLDVSNCYFKEIYNKNDYKFTTSKLHHHNEYELHIVLFGSEQYEVNGKLYTLNENDGILIPPNIKHRIENVSMDMVKYSVTFSCDRILLKEPAMIMAKPRIINCIRCITEEYHQKYVSAPLLIENHVFEILLLIFRQITAENKKTDIFEGYADKSIHLLKEYISDNIEQNLTVSDVASYCHISERQLSRNFMSYFGISPAKYIHLEKMKQIELLLRESDTSLLDISERFGFCSEYYFNSACKKHFGIPPNAYRKMYRSTE